MVLDPACLVSELDTIGDRLGDLSPSNSAWVGSCSGSGPGVIHQFQNKHPTGFPACEDPLSPHLDLGPTEPLLVINRVSTFPNQRQRGTSMTTDSALPALVSTRMRRGVECYVRRHDRNPVLVVIEGLKRFEYPRRIESMRRMRNGNRHVSSAKKWTTGIAAGLCIVLC